jgi:hypothetical protein
MRCTKASATLHGFCADSIRHRPRSAKARVVKGLQEGKSAPEPSLTPPAARVIGIIEISDDEEEGGIREDLVGRPVAGRDDEHAQELDDFEDISAETFEQAKKARRMVTPRKRAALRKDADFEYPKLPPLSQPLRRICDLER